MKMVTLKARQAPVRRKAKAHQVGTLKEGRSLEERELPLRMNSWYRWRTSLRPQDTCLFVRG